MKQQNIVEDKLAVYEIDLSAAKNGEINESWLSMFGSALKEILRRMFGEIPDIDTIKKALQEQNENIIGPEIKIKGNQSEIDALVDTLAHEKNYMENYMDHGLADPTTIQSKHQLDDAIEKFENTTGLKWPFK